MSGHGFRNSLMDREFPPIRMPFGNGLRLDRDGRHGWNVMGSGQTEAAMNSESPRWEQRPACSYVAVAARIPRERIPGFFPEAMQRVTRWLADMGQVPAGPPMARYLACQEDGTLDLEVGFPTAGPIPSDGGFHGATLPGGRYAVLVHAGPYDGLHESTRRLYQWMAETGGGSGDSVTSQTRPGGVHIERYLTNPEILPDPADWRTEISLWMP